MSEITKTISSSDRLALYALWRLAKDHYCKAREYESEMMRRAGQTDWQGRLSDAIYSSDERGTEAEFDRALLADGIVVGDDH